MSNTIKESELDALAPDKTIAKLRALDNAGASVSVTPAQAAVAIAPPLATPLAPILAPIIAPMLGLDHTLLTEQIVPGEFWIGADGSKKQVYVRTFVGTTPTSFEHKGSTHLYPWLWGINAGCKIVKEDLHASQVDECLDEYSRGVCAAITNIEELMRERMCGTYNFAEFFDKRQI